jgi:2-polyprenyl-6-hydroxyphenyl methylase/3-demethylubiquinone-9 3-methyltransferase
LDYDPDSVACTREVKQRFLPEASHWTIDWGNALDGPALADLGEWDVVYSWGVLHHTGAMWDALANVAQLVAPDGALFISIYNDQGRRSRGWRGVKQLYNGGTLGRATVTAVFVPYFAGKTFAASLLQGNNPVSAFRDYKRERGMSITHDWFDWLGGYPFDVARPDEIFSFYSERGFTLERMTTVGTGLGCNEFVFRKRS